MAWHRGMAFSSVLSRGLGQSPVRMFNFKERCLEALADALTNTPAFNATADQARGTFVGCDHVSPSSPP